MIQLIASDLDCTIIDKNNQISPRNIEAMNYIHNRGIPFVICTGKSYSISKNICENFKADFGIFGNGTQIINILTNEELFKKTISKEDLLFIATLAQRFNLHMHIYTDKELITESLEYMDLRNFKLNYSNELEFKIIDNMINYIEENYSNVFSVIVSSEDASLTDFEQFLAINKNIDSSFINKRGIYRDNIINKDYEYIIITPNNINKDIALTYLCDHLDIPRIDVLAIGDNVNDIEMVKNSGIGVAVNDSYDELKKFATYVTTSSVTEGAFAEAIEQYVMYK